MIIEIDGIRWSVVPQYRRCGKASCRVCREGPGHGPYFYGWAMVDGRKRSRYIGRTLPEGVQATQEGPVEVEKLQAKIKALQRENEVLREKNETLKRGLENIRLYESGHSAQEKEWVPSELSEFDFVNWCTKRKHALILCYETNSGGSFTAETFPVSVEWGRNVEYLRIDEASYQVLNMHKRLQWEHAPYEIQFRVQTAEGIVWNITFQSEYKENLQYEAKRLYLL